MEKQLKVINCCPHTVSVITGSIFDPAIGKNRGGTVVIQFPASGFVATAKSSVDLLPSLVLDGISIPFCKRSFSKLSELPKGYDCYIVSSVYAQAAKELGMDTSRYLTPYGTVIGEDGTVTGCIGLVQCD